MRPATIGTGGACVTARGYPWPPGADGSRPEWTGSAFRVSGREVRVMTYTAGSSGWSDGLTQLHEESAGGDHPIDRMSRDWAVAALRRHNRHDAPTLLEIGCSSGFLLRRLKTDFPQATVIGSDFLKDPLDRLAAHLTGIPLLQFDAVRCPLPDESIDATILLNVLEHIGHDLDAMRQVARILRPGGIAVVEVPAGPHLYDAYDEHLQHYRRYSASSLRSLLASAGLTIVDQSHLGVFAYPGFIAVKRRNQRFLNAADSDVRRQLVETEIRQTRGSRLLRGVLRVEAWLGRFVSFPFGIRCVAVGRKP